MALSAEAAAAAVAAGSAALPAIFLDKDGTLLEDEPYNVDPAQMRFEAGAERGLRLLGELGCPLIVVSNQPGVAEQRFAEGALAAVFERLHEMFATCDARLTGFIYCPHARPAPDQPRCGCRKPEPGLLFAAAARFGLDLSRSWMVGDILDDVEAGRRAGCRTVLLDNGHETEWLQSPWRRPDLRADDMAAAAQAIRAQWNREAAA